MLGLIRDTRIELENPVLKYGNDFLPDKTNGGFVTQDRHGAVSPDLFRSRSTLVLGLNQQNQPEKGEAQWEVRIPKGSRKNLHTATLSIRSVRIQAGLHLHGNYSPHPINPNAVAQICLNEKMIDVLHLVKYQMPFGTDYGFGRELSYPIENILDNNDKKLETWNIHLKVGDGVMWDIDELSIQITTKRKRVKSGFWVFTGIVIGWLLDSLTALALHR